MSPARSVYTRDQLRARHAYKRVERFRDDHAGAWDSYRSQVNDLGATILRNGLVAALAFIERRGDDAAKALLADLATHDTPGLGGQESGDALLEAVRGLDVDAYMLATRELLALAIWLRRAVAALSPRRRPGADESGDGGDETARGVGHA